MAYVLLRRLPVANVAPATGYTVAVDQYDLRARRLYRDGYQAPTNTGANAPFELALNQLVPGASFCYGSTLREVRYAGNGTVSTRDNPNAPACASGLGGLTLTASGIFDTVGGGDNTGTAYEQTQQLTATWSGATGPVTVRCALLMPGTADAAPYYEVRNVAAGTAAAAFPAVVGQPIGLTVGRREGSRLTYFGGSAGLGPGRYRVEVTEDATGTTRTQEISLAPVSAYNLAVVRLYGKGTTGPGSRYTVLSNGPLRVVLRQPSALPTAAVEEIYVERQQADDVLLRLLVQPQSSTQARIQAWVYRNGAVTAGDYTLDSAALLLSPSFGDVLPAYEYALPAGWPVGGPATRPLVSDGRGLLQTLRYDPNDRLELANLILFHPPTPTAATGGVLVEITDSYDAHRDQALPLSYQLFEAFDGAGTRLQFNSTGRFDGLGHGGYSVSVGNGYTSRVVNFTLSADYGLRWVLEFSDFGNNTPCRLELWPQGYAGPSETLCGQDNPVTIAEEGIQGGDGQADLGPSVGKAMTLRLRAVPGQLQELMTSDRSCRADFYYGGALQFTGFVEQGIYSETLLAGPVDVELTATCGLAGLKDLTFSGHVGQELRGRFSRLDTLLHCLSRTGLSLPVVIGANLRAAELLTDETPEEFIYTDRQAYTDQDLRAVVDALCQSLGGTLVQRNGQWLLLSVLEAAKPAPARRYQPAGTNRQALTVGAPTGRLVPERIAKADRAGGAARAWYWLGADQGLQRRAGWRFFTGKADATFAENALRQGEYFSNANGWDRSATVLLPEAGWQAGPDGFPVALMEAGAQNDELATAWPEALTNTDGRYLESELAPVEAGREAVAFEVSLTAKFVAPSLETAWLWVEVVSVRGTAAVDSFGAMLRVAAVDSLTDGFTTVSAVIPVGLLAGGGAPRLRLHAYTVTTRGRRRDGSGLLLVQKVGLQVRPQGAKWDGKTVFVASGAGGSVRPTSPLEVFHVDAPDKAGLFLGTAAAFRRTLTRFAGIPTTQWARADDLQPAPMLASQVLDVLALRGNPSRLLTGTVRHLGLPPELLDSLDLPYEPAVVGRRFAVASRTWHVKLNETDLTLVEIGEGEGAPYLLPDHARILDGRPGGRLRVRGTHRGIRITSGS